MSNFLFDHASKISISTAVGLLCLTNDLTGALAKPTIAKVDKCSTILAKSRSSLPNVSRFDISRLTKYDGIPPKGRTQYLNIISYGVKESTSLAMAKRIIAACPKIGIVRFVIYGTDDQSVYGLLNGKVQRFKCNSRVPGDPSQWDKYPNKWGEYFCS